jgi:hypothetical protein
MFSVHDLEVQKGENVLLELEPPGTKQIVINEPIANSFTFIFYA